MIKRLFLSLVFVCVAICTFAANEVSWTIRLEGDNTDSPKVVMTATIAPGFHLYAPENPAGGSQPLEFYITPKGCKLDGKPVANKKYTKEYDDVFMVDQYFFSNSVTFTQKLKPTAEKFSVGVEIKGQTCNDGGCYPVFASKSLSGKGKVDPAAAKEAEAEQVEAVVENTDSVHAAETLLPAADLSGSDADKSWWTNVEAEIKALEEDKDEESRSIWYIFIAGFIGGLIALMTPCVWPMIPMTVSFFLKQNKERAKAIRSGIIYGLSIIVIYLALGIAVTAIFGASALNELATSALFNIIFFLLLVLFAFSFMGGFELTLPSKWTNSVDSKVDSTSGYLSIFFMAFTLVLVSFSCTGPIIGTLLVEAAATSNFISPAVGMGAFALALALPFTLFAIFPSWLKSMPKSGGWLNTVKVVLGFLELALSLKFLSVADLAYGWRILDREVFLSLWIVIFALLAIYLWGKIRFPHDDKVEKVGITRFMLGVISMAFAVYMLPGLWGAPLKSTSAFAPPLTTQDFSLYDGEVHAKTMDFDEAIRMGKAAGKPVLVDFSGYGCVNCRKMEAAVWTDPEVKNMIDDKFILVTLMVDDKQPLPQPVKVKETDGTERTLRTVGDKWSYLQRSKFGANAQPYYVVLDADAKPVSPSYAFDENVGKYKDFLNNAVKTFDTKRQPAE
ncbi:MAG: cytochrome c biogenesis protein CcdA [Muribaculaceae bacterium]|nr:cytochrome c biogenesis protein CcdA [Muribaculaceae bacterium]